MSEQSSTDHPGQAAEEAGIVDQQASALEQIERETDDGDGDPMGGEAPTG